MEIFSPPPVQNEDFTEEKIHFGVEGIYIDSWMRRRVYDAFKEVLESGVRHHLQVRTNPRSRSVCEINILFTAEISSISATNNVLIKFLKGF